MIRLGVCAGAEFIDEAARGGCDYIEPSFTAVADLPGDEYQRTLERFLRAPIGAEAMNGFIPGRYRITGPAADFAPIIPFMERGFERAGALGVGIVVFGSSGARNMPEGFADRERAAEQCAAFLREAAPIAQSFGIRIAVEPLCYREANLINTVREAAALARMTDHPAVGVLADYYHMLYNREGLGGIAEASGLLWHCHIASGGGRVIPLPGDGEDYGAFFTALRAAGYDGRVSIEGRIPDPAAQIGPSIAMMRKLCG